MLDSLLLEKLGLVILHAWFTSTRGLDLDKGKGVCAADLFGAPRRATVLVINQIFYMSNMLTVKEYLNYRDKVSYIPVLEIRG